MNNKLNILFIVITIFLMKKISLHCHIAIQKCNGWRKDQVDCGNFLIHWSSLLVPNLGPCERNDIQRETGREANKADAAAAKELELELEDKSLWDVDCRGPIDYCGPFSFNPDILRNINRHRLASKLNLSNTTWSTSSSLPSRMRWQVARAW